MTAIEEDNDRWFDASHPSMPHVLTAEMTRLFNAGFPLIPLGGDDGKKAIIRFANRRRLPLQVVMDRLLASGSRTYGIRLSGLLVLDVDTDNDAAREYVVQRFGASPARTRTKRGFHLYFRHVGDKPTNVDLPGIRIDFKAGDNSYVIGPGSHRPDGTIYRAEGLLSSPTNLPWFVDRNARGHNLLPATPTHRVQRGLRRSSLKIRARELVVTVDTFDELLEELLAFRDWEVENPGEFPDAEIAALAQWYWDKREAGEIWGGSNSGIFIHRYAIDELARRGDALALLVYNIVVATHGHRRDREFAFAPDALRKSGRIAAGRVQLYNAVHTLVELGLLRRRAFWRGKRVFYRYLLGSPWMQRTQEEGSRLTLVLDTSTSRSPGQPKETAA